MFNFNKSKRNSYAPFAVADESITKNIDAFSKYESLKFYVIHNFQKKFSLIHPKIPCQIILLNILKKKIPIYKYWVETPK